MLTSTQELGCNKKGFNYEIPNKEGCINAHLAQKAEEERSVGSPTTYGLI
jgi:hypothetical protein